MAHGGVGGLLHGRGRHVADGDAWRCETHRAITGMVLAVAGGSPRDMFWPGGQIKAGTCPCPGGRLPMGPTGRQGGDDGGQGGGGGLPAWTTGHWTFLERVSARPLCPEQQPPHPFSTREDGLGGTWETEQEELESPSDSEARRPATQQTGDPAGLWKGGPPSTAQTSLDEGQSPGW